MWIKGSLPWSLIFKKYIYLLSLHTFHIYILLISLKSRVGIVITSDYWTDSRWWWFVLFYFAFTLLILKHIMMLFIDDNAPFTIFPVKWTRKKRKEKENRMSDFNFRIYIRMNSLFSCLTVIFRFLICECHTYTALTMKNHLFNDINMKCN